MQSSKLGMWKGYHLSIESQERGTFSVENGIQKGKGLDIGEEPPCITLLSSPPRGAEQADVNFNFLISDMDHILNQTSLLNIYVAFVMNSNE